MKVMYNTKNRYVRLTPEDPKMIPLLKAALEAAGCETVNKYNWTESSKSVYINSVGADK